MPECNVKNSVALEHALPEPSVKLRQLYIGKYRPHLCEAESNALFPGNAPGGFKSIGALRAQLMRAIRRYTGLIVNPHLFRHIAAKLHLDTYPGEYGVVMEVLGHKREATTRRAYTGLETDAAVHEGSV